MSTRVALTGNEAAANAMRQINPDVIAAFPITPSTPIPMTISQFIADGKMTTEFITVESEHSALSACVGASAAGGRTMTATSANGLALMFEILYIASGMRRPIVAPVVARALSGPLNIHGDYSDVYGVREAGWVQIFCEDSQEYYDTIIQSIGISEDESVLIPVMPITDGFDVSHMVENWYMEDNKAVQEFIGEYHPKYSLLDTEHPVTFGAWAPPDWYYEHRRSQLEGLTNAYYAVKKIGAEFGEKFGRSYGVVEKYRTDGAEVVLVGMGGISGTVKDAIDNMRDNGVAAGFLRIRLFRPFPYKDVIDVLKDAKAIGVFDRCTAAGAQTAALCTDIKSAMYGITSVPIINYTYGLGGRDTTVEDMEKVVAEVKGAADGKKVDPVNYINLRS